MLYRQIFTFQFFTFISSYFLIFFLLSLLYTLLIWYMMLVASCSPSIYKYTLFNEIYTMSIETDVFVCGIDRDRYRQIEMNIDSVLFVSEIDDHGRYIQIMEIDRNKYRFRPLCMQVRSSIAIVLLKQLPGYKRLMRKMMDEKV